MESRETQELDRAMALAKQAHAGQVDLAGRDYFEHLTRVAGLVAQDGIRAQTVAYLHDIVEDTSVTATDLITEGFSSDVVQAVTTLTRVDGVPYADYIEGVRRSGDRLALAVKIADLTDHLRPTCPVHLRPRYEVALKRLTT